MIMTTRRFTIFLLIGHKLRLFGLSSNGPSSTNRGPQKERNDEKKKKKK
jgi:hypothetical protein